MSNATRKDVAKRAGVSVATVSNVLNNPHIVREDTVVKIKVAMEELDYRPNLVARSLITNRSMQLGILLEDIRNPFYSEIVEHFEAAAEQKGYFVSICPGLTKVDRYFDNFISRNLDGIFVAALPHHFETEKLYSLVNKGIKIVVSGNINADFRLVSSIEHDFKKAMETALTYLRSLGHEHIAYLSGLAGEFSFDERCSSYIELTDRLKLPCGQNLLVDGCYPYRTDPKTGYEQARRLIDMNSIFTAVICGNDLMAIGAIRAFEEAGLRVPDDVSVMGFDGIEIGQYIRRPLTTMSVNREFFGRKVFDLLYNNIQNDVTGFFRNLLSLHEGESTAPRREI